MNGIVIVDKPQGWTSQDVVSKLRGVFQTRRIGHGGTLDPMATGVLPVFVGRATRGVEFFEHADKTYEAVLQLGISTDTEDTTGTVLEKKPVAVTKEQFLAALEQFRGEIEQIPPMYSALKVNGQKLYDLARQGKEVERKSRKITIFRLKCLEFSGASARLLVHCSKGTYIRTLCADVGEKLGCGGTMQSLLRTKVERFVLEDAITLSELEKLRDEGRIGDVLVPVDKVFAECPALHVRADLAKLLENGNAIYPNQTEEKKYYAPGKQVRFYRNDESFAGIYAYDEKEKRYKPVKMFLER